MNYYVYEHIRKDTNQVFYVGKGKDNRAFKYSGRNIYWKRIVEKSDGFEINFLVKNVDEELSLLVEIERIDQLKRLGAKLSNLTDGGEGISGFVMSESARKILSEKAQGRPSAWKGKTHSEETKKKMSELAIGRPSPFKGKKQSAEARKHLSELKKGKPGTPHTQEWIDKMVKLHTGRKRSAETCINISKSKKGIKQNSMWITDGEVNQKVPKDAGIPDGWKRGRNIAYLNSK